MSVFVLSSAEFGSIIASLKTPRTHSGELFFPLSEDERSDAEVFLPGKSEEQFALKLIGSFVARLYLANQLAMQYTYLKPTQKEIVIPIITFPNKPPLLLPELLSELKSLSYNCVTNGGNTFLGASDREKLDQIIDRVERELRHK